MAQLGYYTQKSLMGQGKTLLFCDLVGQGQRGQRVQNSYFPLYWMKKYLLKYLMESENSFAGWKGTMRILGNTVRINPEIHSAGAAAPWNTLLLNFRGL